MNWNVRVTKTAEKFLLRMQKAERERVKDVLKDMRENPFAGDIVWLKDQKSDLRRRTGNWRILFSLDTENKIVWIEDIDRRTTTTYKKR